MKPIRTGPRRDTGGRLGPHGQDGFTLIETLIAIMILMVGLVAITNLFAVAISSTSVANLSTAASAQAAQQMETLKAIPFDDTRLASGGDLDSNATNYSRVVEIAGVGRINVRWLIETVDNQTKFIVVRAEALDGIGPRRTRAEFRSFRSCTTTTTGCPTL